MTRINVVEPSSLSDQHLVAEYREIMRLPGNLKTSLNRKTKKFTMEEIPKAYTLGKGHVKFFYDKMAYLDKRFKQLVAEMKKRGFATNFENTNIFKDCPQEFLNDYTPDAYAREINIKRLKERSDE